MHFLTPTYIIALLIAISVHEWAHAFTATKLGDPTPGHEGRLTVNPLAHIDLLGALMFVTVGFGWAKPVPINPVYFKRMKRDVCLTAIAGPLSNLILALIAFIGLRLLGFPVNASPWSLLQMDIDGNVTRIFLGQVLRGSLFANLGLMAFNLIPIAPLDGSKVLEAFIPHHLADKYDEFMRIGMYIVIGLFVGEMFFGIHTLSVWIGAVMGWALRGMDATIGMILP